MGEAGSVRTSPAAYPDVPCAQPLEGWRAQIAGEYEALTLEEWEARGRGYRGIMLGG
jgi:hypothetical protein